MTIIVNRDALIQALAKVRSLVKTSQIIDIAKCCKISVERNRLSITTTNFDTQATAVIDCSSDNDFQIALDVHALSTFVGKLSKNNDVTITAEGKISSGRARATISPLPADNFPMHNQHDSIASFSLTPGQAFHLLVTPNKSADTNSARIYLCGVTLQCQGNEMLGTASDTKTVIRSKSVVESPSFEPIIIPSGAVQTLSGMVDENNIEVDLHDGAISFFNGGFHLVSRLINENPAPFESILQSEFTHQASVDRLDLLAAIDRVGCMTEHQDNLIKVHLNGGPMIIESAVGGSKSAVEEIDASHDGDDVTLGMNAKQLAMLTGVMTSETIDIRYRDEKSPMSIDDPTFEGQTIISPVRV